MTYYYSYLHRNDKKYNATSCLCSHQHRHDSKKEARRCDELYFLLAQGIIRDLEQQPVFLLQDKFRFKGEAIRAIKYIADFKYFDLEKNIIVVEDSKGMRTDVFNLKEKLFKKYLLDNNLNYDFLIT
jgi:hypothetical protein